MIVQAMVLYYGIRQANVNITPLFAGVMVTVLNTGAYMAETVRAGIGSIDMGTERRRLGHGNVTYEDHDLCSTSTGLQKTSSLRWQIHFLQI